MCLFFVCERAYRLGHVQRGTEVRWVGSPCVAERHVVKHASRKILIVHDDEPTDRLLRCLFEGEYRLARASTGEETLEMLPYFEPDMAMLDIALPGIDGYETCRRIRSSPHGHGLQVVMMSAESSIEERNRDYGVGADDYVVRPFDPNELHAKVRLHFRLRHSSDMDLPETGGGDFSSATAERCEDACGQHAQQAQDMTVAALIKMAEFRDTETGEHLCRIRSYSQILAEELGRHRPNADEIDEQFLEDLYRASPLHDIGKVGISDAILLKPGQLTDSEFETMKHHTTIGANILEHLAFETSGQGALFMAAVVARFHHERYDGSGYPARLVGTEIPLPARIVGLVDAFDAITSARPYKEPLSTVTAKEIIEKDSGSHFDPVVVGAFLRRFDTMVSVHSQIQDNAPVVIGASSLLHEHLVGAGG